MALLGIYLLVVVARGSGAWLALRIGADSATMWMFVIWPVLLLGAAAGIFAFRVWVLPRIAAALVDRIVRQRAGGRGGTP